jgi:FtsP/CotA-like multicopper oxidase with cupredoxin domain
MSGPRDDKKRPNKIKAKKERENELSRRSMLKLTAAAGAGSVLAPIVLTSKKSTVLAQGTVAEPVLCPPVTPPNTGPASPAHTPFADNLPIPLPPVPQFLNPAPTKTANLAGGEAPRAPHQRWEEFLPALGYMLEARAAEHTFHSDFLPSYIWGFNGRYPAPTILTAYGVPTIVRFKNSLPFPTESFGTPQITIHLHNGHTASESDGFAQDFFPETLGPTGGLFKDNHYALAYAGIDAFGGNGDPREAMHTFWFHDHRAAETANSNYLGMNGMFIAYDQTDPGHELNTSGSLRLPNYYGITDIPLILGEKRFCPAANGRNELFQVQGQGSPGGDKFTVNGKIQPKMTVRRRKYRFRILNTGPVKGGTGTFSLKLIDKNGVQKPMTVVAVDANFLHTPVDVSATSSPSSLDIFVSSRFDVIIDFSQFAAGDRVYLRENAAQNVTGGGPALPDPAPGLPMVNVLMAFDVVNRESWFPPDTPAIPSTLVELPPVPPNDLPEPFQISFKLVNGRFLINDEEFIHDDPFHVVMKGTSEEWHLNNDTLAGNWVHPVHIHFEEGRILERTVCTVPSATGCLPGDRQVQTLPGWEQTNNARRDVYPLPGQNGLKIRLAFRDFIGRYLIHCHNMNHEDGFMMARWDIVDTEAALVRTRRQIAERRRAKGLDPGLPKGVRA